MSNYTWYLWGGIMILYNIKIRLLICVIEVKRGKYEYGVLFFLQNLDFLLFFKYNISVRHDYSVCGRENRSLFVFVFHLPSFLRLGRFFIFLIQKNERKLFLNTMKARLFWLLFKDSFFCYKEWIICLFPIFGNLSFLI